MIIQLVSETALTSGGDYDLVEGIYPGSDVAYYNIDARELTLATWAIMTEQNAVFTITGGLRRGSGTYDTLLTVNITGGTLSTPYDLAAPYNNTGAFVITRPFLVFNIADAATAAHAYTRVYVKLW